VDQFEVNLDAIGYPKHGQLTEYVNHNINWIQFRLICDFDWGLCKIVQFGL